MAERPSGSYQAEDARRFWPRLSCFPLTNGIGVFTIVAWSVTGLAALVGAIFHHTHNGAVVPAYAVPPEWIEALKWITAYAFVQFGVKRWTNGRGTNGNGNGAAVGGGGMTSPPPVPR